MSRVAVTTPAAAALERLPFVADEVPGEHFGVCSRVPLGLPKRKRSTYIPIVPEKQARRRRRPSRRAMAQPERCQRIYGRTISVECLNGYHFCKCPMLNCACVCHDMDREAPEDITHVRVS